MDDGSVSGSRRCGMHTVRYLDRAAAGCIWNGLRLKERPYPAPEKVLAYAER